MSKSEEKSIKEADSTTQSDSKQTYQRYICDRKIVVKANSSEEAEKEFEKVKKNLKQQMQKESESSK